MTDVMVLSTEDKKQPKVKLAFSYSVVWEEHGDLAWASRWDTYMYLHMSDVQIHWFAICNSVAIVLYLSGEGEGGREGEREGGKEGRRDGEREREGGREGGRERGRCHHIHHVQHSMVYILSCPVLYVGILALIIIRTLRRDIARYNKDEEMVSSMITTLGGDPSN